MKMRSVQYDQQIISLIDQLVDIVKANGKHPSYKRLSTVNRFVIFSENVLKYGLVLNGLPVILNCSIPFYMYFHAGEFFPVTPYHMPFVDDTTFVGYSILMTFQIFALLLGFVGSSCYDFIFLLIVINIPMLAYLFCATIDELNDQAKAAKSNLLVAKAQLRNILLQHLQIVELSLQNISLCIWRESSRCDRRSRAEQLITSESNLTLSLIGICNCSRVRST